MLRLTILACLAAPVWAERPLEKYGLGDPKTPVSVSLIVMPSDASRRPTLTSNGRAAPNETVWVFEDPTPVWRAFESAGHGRFEEGRFVDPRDVWLVVQRGRDFDREAPRVYFHAERGLLTILQVAAPTSRGGTWSIGAEVEELLVALLSKTEPDTIGGWLIWLDDARWFGRDNEVPLEVRVLRSRDRLSLLPREFVPEVPRLPRRSGEDQPIELGPQAYFAIWTKQHAPKRRLRHERYPSIRQGQVRWKLTHEDSREELRGAPGFVGVFELPIEFKRVVVELDSGLVCVVELDERGEFVPEGEPRRVELRDGVCLLFANGGFQWIRAGKATICGTLPADLRATPDPDQLDRYLEARRG